MPNYTYDQLDAGVKELKAKAIEKALLAAAMGPEDQEYNPRTPEERAEAGRIEAFFDMVPSLFAPFKPMPEPGQFRDLANHLISSAQKLSTTQNTIKPAFDIPSVPQDGFSHINTAAAALADWNGRAAREFKANYLDPLPIQLAGQFNLIAVGAKLMEEEAKLWEQARLNVADILNQGINAMDNMDQFCTKNTWTITLTTIAAVATVMAVPLAGAALTLAAVDATVSVAATVLPDDPPKTVACAGETADQVIAETARALSELADFITAQEAKIAMAFTSGVRMVEGHRASFVPASPLIGTTTSSNLADDQHFGTAS